MATTLNGIDPVQAAGTPAAASSAQRTPEQLRTLAAQFESMLLTQMMNSMRSSMFDDKDEDAGFAKGPLADALYGELSLALSRAGGMGLGESLLGPLMRQVGQFGATAGTSGMLSTPLSVTMPAGISGFDSTDSLPLAAGPEALAARATMTALSSMNGDGGQPAQPDLLSPSVSLVAGRISSEYGWRQDPLDGTLRFHRGTDIAIPTGQDVPAAQAGQVVFAGERSGYGLTVEVSHGGGLTTRYAHLSEISVGVGDSVAEGQTIAKSGASGRVTGPHLHFEVLDQGQSVDPSTGLMRLAAAGRSVD
jgi:Rod binding domain-containing protein